MSSGPDELAKGAVQDLYLGPLDTFISRREALVKELRASKKREAAAAVKALKKPSRTAWALNLVALKEPAALGELEAAIRDVVESLSSSDGTRESVAGLRTAIREFASEAARLAREGGTEVEVNALEAALSAVLGRTESFEELRGGQLSEVPEAGGLDLLNSLPALVDTAPSSKRETSIPAGRRSVRSRKEDERRAAAERAASELVAARKRAGEAEQALRDAEATLATAEARLREANEAVQTAQTRRDHAQTEWEAATVAVRAAEDRTRGQAS